MGLCLAGSLIVFVLESPRPSTWNLLPNAHDREHCERTPWTSSATLLDHDQPSLHPRIQNGQATSARTLKGSRQLAWEFRTTFYWGTSSSLPEALYNYLLVRRGPPTGIGFGTLWFRSSAPTGYILRVVQGFRIPRQGPRQVILRALALHYMIFYYTKHTTLYFTIYYMILYYTILYYTILYYTILYYTILYYTILCYTILYYTILYYTILYYTILYYTILYYTILYYTILYYTILYYTILYYTILYYTILYCHYTILYSSILYYSIL